VHPFVGSNAVKEANAEKRGNADKEEKENHDIE
jgi:hypothetical protein